MNSLFHSCIVFLFMIDSTRPKRSPVHTAQKAKDVGRLINYATLHDRAYIQRITTDIGINHARCRSNIDGLNVFTCLILSETRKGMYETTDFFLLQNLNKILIITVKTPIYGGNVNLYTTCYYLKR